MALVWYAVMQTSSGVWAAAFTVGSYLPQFLISFIGGVWADRYHRKKPIISADMLPLQWIMIGSGIALILIAGITYSNRELN